MILRSFIVFLTSLALLQAEDLIFAEGSEWEVLSTDHQFAEGMAWDKDGHFYFTDVPRGQLFKIDKDTGEKTLIDGDTGKANGIAFGPDGRLYGCSAGGKCIHAWDPETWEKTIINEGTHSNDIAILDNGTIFYTDPLTKMVWRLTAGTFERDPAATLDFKPNGIALSLDQQTLLVAEFDSDTIHGFTIGPDSSLSGASQPAYRLAVPSDGKGFLDGMMVLPNDRLLSGTSLGTQIVPKIAGAGKHLVVPSPEGRPRCNYARISPDGKWIYTAYREDLLRRRINPGLLK